jgi:hypothetical protein
VSSTGKHQLFKSGPADNTKSSLIRGEGAGFLQKIKEVNQEFAVIFKEWIESVVAFPNLGRQAEGFKASRLKEHLSHYVLCV